jgi:hypothetical protein
METQRVILGRAKRQSRANIINNNTKIKQTIMALKVKALENLQVFSNKNTEPTCGRPTLIEVSFTYLL